MQQVSESLTHQDKKILTVKYAAEPIKNLSEQTLFPLASALIFKIHVITGWTIPMDENSAYVNALQDQIRKKLVEDYEDYNFEELEYAFRNYGTSVKDWGKSFNLNLIDTVMNAYIAHRKNVSDYEDRLLKPLGLNYTPSADEIINGNRELIELRYQNYLNGDTGISFAPEIGVLQLAVDGFTDSEIWQDFTKQALRYHKTELSKIRELLIVGGKSEHAKEAAQRITDLKETDEIIISIAKKLALVFCFEQFKKAGAENIYKQVQ